MTKTTTICDRCGKEFKPNDVMHKRTILLKDSNNEYFEYDLCQTCSLAFVTFLKGGRNEDNA